MITFCLLVYIVLTFRMAIQMLRMLMAQTDTDKVIIEFFGTIVFFTLFVIGIMTLWNLYNTHLTIGA